MKNQQLTFSEIALITVLSGWSDNNSHQNNVKQYRYIIIVSTWETLLPYPYLIQELHQEFQQNKILYGKIIV